MNIRTFFAAQPRRRDPPEGWELPYSESEGGAYYRGIHDSYPRTPDDEQDLPAGALSALAEQCGIDGLNNLFVVPMAIRSTGFRDEKVISPESVIAVGSAAVGLWTGEPEPGIRAIIPVSKLSGIEDVTILLYGRLSFLSAETRLTIRYNTVARRALEPALLELRRRISGAAQPVPVESGGAPEALPFKWRYLLDTNLARLNTGSQAVYRYAKAPRAWRHDIERGQMLVMNPRELVFISDPLESFTHYGEDSYIVPRSRIEDMEHARDGLVVASNGTRILLPMEESLRDAAFAWLPVAEAAT